MTRSTYLTKSRFKEGLECLTKLYYTGKKNTYANQSLEDLFLKTLAEGGFQVGELAKYSFVENPVSEQITIETNQHEEALAETQKRLEQAGKVIVAEAAFSFRNLFIRADLIVKEGNVIDLYEVKAKSFDFKNGIDELISNKDKKNECISSVWVSYVYDLAFQKYVMQQALPNFTINAHLLLVDKSKKASIDGLNQKFQLVRDGSRTKIKVDPFLTAKELGSSILSALNLNDLIEKIYHNYVVPTTYKSNVSFEGYVKLCEETYVNDQRIQAPLTSACKGCTYRTKVGKDDHLLDGFKECWKTHTNYSDQLLEEPLVIDLWMGGVNKFMDQNVYLLNQLNPEDIEGNGRKKDENGLSRSERRLLQVNKVKDNDASYYFDKIGFEEEKMKWTWPLHLIDFETSMVALPFHINTSPYQGIAFQFSHHVINQDGSIEHKNQFLHFEKGVYPNLAFIRALKTSLGTDEGTIFRYHNHENTYLRMIYSQIESGTWAIEAQEKNELLAFINHITRFKPLGEKEYIHGKRAMVDLYDLVAKYYYSPFARGKVGLKFILPAIIKDSPFLKQKYHSNEIYGKNKTIKSLNFDAQQWIDSSKNNDPYKTLPKIFDKYEADDFDELVVGLEDVADGGAALTAYNYLQYTHISNQEKELISNALLRYCELDTMAMVMLIEGMNNLNHQI